MEAGPSCTGAACPLETEVAVSEPRRVSAAVLVALAAIVAATPLRAEEAAEKAPAGGKWALASELNVTLTQNAYSENWAGSESGALSWALNSNSIAERQVSPALHSKTTLRLAFGQTHSQDGETKVWARPVKSTDLIDAESVLRLTRGWAVDPFVSGRAQTQFVDETDPSENVFLNPILFTESVGVSRTLINREDREWSVRLGGALRQHTDRNVPPDEGEDRETVTTTDGGAEVVSNFKTSLADGKISLTSDLTVFQGLYNSEEDKLEGTPGADDWKSPDVNWENRFTANITNYLMVNLYVQLLYDKEVEQSVRVKETLSLGFTFRLT